MTRLSFVLPLAALVLLAGVFFAYLRMIENGKEISDLPSALIDKPAPQFSLPPLAGHDKGLATADFMGKVSVVNVFASWCIPCRAEHPVIERLAKLNVAPVYGINYKDKAADAQQWLKNFGDPYTAVGADESGRVGIDWGVYGVPETFIVGPDGMIRLKHVGPLTPQALEEEILPAIRKLGS
jgi:cytochrome c biogenesis protein CcmG/thiol:disulfide interchange protein DsbE